MTENPRVAILVLNYNGLSCLSRCLRFLQTLEYQHHTVIVIDNGSQDQSFQLAQKDFPENVYIPKAVNTGFAAGMNTGIQYAIQEQYDFVWLMNSDAEVYPESLDYLIQACQNDSNIQAASPVIVNQAGEIWFAGGHINYLRMRTEHTKEMLRNTPYQTSFLTGCALLLSTKLLQDIGIFDERFFLYYEDADLSTRIRNFGVDLYVIPKARVLHHEKSQDNPQKLYYLVHYGLLFFALHTPEYLRLYVGPYVTIRVLVNRIKLLIGSPSAAIVNKAYADYFQKFQAGHHLYLRKLS